jgi:pimeloyl-ACP methyl ester carboxylesterase
VLLGSSHGGAIALLAANIAGEVGINIRSLILVAPVNPWSRNGGRLAALAGSGLGAAAIRALSPCLRPLHGYFLRRMYGDRARLTRDSVEGYSRAFKQRGSMAHLLGRVKDWPAMLAATEQALPACSKLPIFIIWGERDRAVDPQSAQPLLERLACAELAIMKGAGHLPFEEQPEEFNALVSGFLARQAERVYS